MFRRFLPLLLALLACLPADVLARLVEVCRSGDACCCRRDNDAVERKIGATLERPDCCEAPCSVPVASSPALVAAADDDVPGALAQESPPVRRTTAMVDRVLAPGQPRTRGPPGRIHARISHWLI